MGGGYPPPGSQVCPSRGSAQNISGGWYVLSPSPDTPPLGITWRPVSLVKRPVSDGPTWGWAWGWGWLVPHMDLPIPRRSGSDGGYGGTPLPITLLILGTAPPVAGAPNMRVPSPSSGRCRNLRHSSWGLAGLTHHAHHPTDVFMQANMVKEVCSYHTIFLNI